MADFFLSGRVVDVVIGFMLIEALVLAFWHRRTGEGPAPLGFILNLASGFCLLLALRAALTDAGWPWIALSLIAALIAHLVDLAARWRSPR